MTRRSLFRGALAALGFSAIPFKAKDVQVDWIPIVVAEADDVVWATSNSHGWQFFTVFDCRGRGGVAKAAD